MPTKTHLTECWHPGRRPQISHEQSRKDLMVRRSIGPWGSVCLAVLVLMTSSSEATTPPQEGQEFPQEFIEFRAQNPGTFTATNSWQGKTERALRNRLLLRNSGRTEEQLTDAERSQLAVTGNLHIPVIPVMFTPNTTPAPPTQSAIDQILFSNNPTGTVTAYYDEVSYGLFNVTGDVYSYTTLPSAASTYGAGVNGLPPLGGTGQLIQDALTQADVTIDFRMYDNDGPDGVPNSPDDDGFVDLASFVHPRSGGECFGAPLDDIWSHQGTYTSWFGAPYVTGDIGPNGPIQVDTYHIVGALDCTGIGNPLTIGTYAHETGHALGLPDLHDTIPATAPSQGAGQWSLMGRGNWNTPTSPAHMSAWEKSKLGWLTPTLLTATTNNVAIPQVETNPVAYQVVVGNGQYFLIENRQPVGFDQFMSGCGLAIWHVDEATIAAQSQSNWVNTKQNCGPFVETPNEHYGLALEQADGFCQLEGNLSAGDAGDLFPGSTGNPSFTELSNPNSNSYTSGRSDIRVTNISGCGTTMTADIDAFPIASTTSPLDLVFVIDNSGSYGDDWPIIQSQMPAIVTKLTNTFPGIEFGLALFRDFPFSPFGSPNDFAYQEVLPLTTNNSAAFLNSIANLHFPNGGNDGPESQYEAIHQVLFGLGRKLFNNPNLQPGEIAPSGIGWGLGSHRAIVLLTDAPFHDADNEDYPTGTPDVPTPVLEAEGRSAVRSQIANLLSSGLGMTIFTMVAQNPGVFITQGEDGTIPNIPISTLIEQASEITGLTGGGVFFVGPSSEGLADAMDLSIEVLEGRIVPRGEVACHVFEDINGNGIQDAGEAGKAGVDVLITNTHGHTVTVTTDTNGDCDSILVPSGPTVLDVDGNTLPAGTTISTGNDPATVDVTVAESFGVLFGCQPATDLAVTKDDGMLTVIPGSLLAYDIEITNNGPISVPSISVIDMAPPELMNLVFVTPTGTYDPATGEWNNVHLDVGETVTMTLQAVVKQSATGTLTNTVCVAPPPDITDSDSSNDCDHDVDTIEAQADLGVMKSNGKTFVIPGEMLSYSIEVVNNGPSTVTELGLFENLPSQLENVSYSASEGMFDPITGLWNGLDLAVGESIKLTVTGTVSNGASGILVNSVLITPPDGIIDPNTDNNTASDSDPVDTSSIFGDGFETGDTSQWSNTAF